MRNRRFENFEIDESVFDGQLKESAPSEMYDMYKHLHKHPLNFDIKYAYGKLSAETSDVKVELFVTKTKKFFINLSTETHTICDFLIDGCVCDISDTIKTSFAIVMKIIDGMYKKPVKKSS